MKRCSFTVCIGLSVGVAMSVSLLGQTDDPSAIRPGSSPVRDAAFYAKKAKDDAENWRAYLKHRGVPNLETLKEDKAAEIYRFIYVPCFHQQLIITARREEGKVTLEIRRFSEKGRLELSGSLEMGDDDFSGFRQEFSKPEIYDPLRGLTASQRDSLPMVLDGAMWHLETLRNGRYTHADLYSPEAFDSLTKKEKTVLEKESGFALPDLRPFVFFCLEFVRLSGLPLDTFNYEPMPRHGR